MPAITRIAAVMLCVFAAASAAQAQQRLRAVPNVIPSASSRIAQSAPKPTGLMPAFPAGLTAGSGAAVSPNPIAQSTTAIPPGGSTVAATTLTPAELPPAELPADPGSGVTLTGAATTVLGAGAPVYGAGAGGTVRGPAQRVAGGAGGYSATDEARSFFFADGNHDGELTRAEFSRLSIATMTFEEMDRNFDSVISRFEYQDSLR